MPLSAIGLSETVSKSLVKIYGLKNKRDLNVHKEIRAIIKARAEQEPDALVSADSIYQIIEVIDRIEEFEVFDKVQKIGISSQYRELLYKELSKLYQNPDDFYLLITLQKNLTLALCKMISPGELISSEQIRELFKKTREDEEYRDQIAPSIEFNLLIQTIFKKAVVDVEYLKQITAIIEFANSNNFEIFDILTTLSNNLLKRVMQILNKYSNKITSRIFRNLCNFATIQLLDDIEGASEGLSDSIRLHLIECTLVARYRDIPVFPSILKWLKRLISNEELGAISVEFIDIIAGLPLETAQLLCEVLSLFYVKGMTINLADVNILINNHQQIKAIHATLELIRKEHHVIANQKVFAAPVAVSNFIHYSQNPAASLMHDKNFLNTLFSFPIEILTDISNRLTDYHEAVLAYKKYLAQTSQQFHDTHLQFFNHNLTHLQSIRECFILLGEMKIPVELNKIESLALYQLLELLQTQEKLQQFKTQDTIQKILSQPKEMIIMLTNAFRLLAINPHFIDQTFSIESVMCLASKPSKTFGLKNGVIFCQVLDKLNQYATQSRQGITPELLKSIKAEKLTLILPVTELFIREKVKIDLQSLVSEPLVSLHTQNLTRRINSFIQVARKRALAFKDEDVTFLTTYHRIGMQEKYRKINAAIARLENYRKTLTPECQLKTVDEALNWKPANSKELSLKEALAQRRFIFASNSVNQVIQATDLEYNKVELRL